MDSLSVPRTLLFATLLVGCSAAHPVPPAAPSPTTLDAAVPTDAAAPTAALAPPAEPSLPCDALPVALEAGTLWIDDPSTDWRAVHSSPRTRVTVRNCSARDPLAIRVQLYARALGPTHRRTELDFGLVLPGEQRHTDAPLADDVAHEAAVSYASSDAAVDGALLRAIPPRAEPSPAVLATRAEFAACTACRGDWGRHGMRGLLGCICRTHDVGRVCEQAEDCEGDCVPTGVRVVTPADRATGRWALSVRVGRCSEFQFQFGCHQYLGPGLRAAGPSMMPALPSDRCAD